VGTAIHDSSIDSYLQDRWLIPQLKLNRHVDQKGVPVKLIISKRVFIQLYFVAYRKKLQVTMQVN
jgi:hypothetical protein